MEEKPAASEEKIFYHALLLALFWGLVGAIALLILTPQVKEPFSALNFPRPDDLPNLVKLGDTYSYLYQVQSFENQSRQYNVKSRLELFRLYDTTEGLYNCLSPYRRKVYISWDNETIPRQLSINDTNPLITDMVILPDNISTINWTTYHFYFTMGRSFGRGEFVVWFGSQDRAIYAISFNALEGRATFGNLTKEANISRQNDKVRIDYDGENVNVSLNRETLFFATIANATRGQFGFETRDMFISLSQMMVAKTDPIEVPDQGNVWDYVVDDNYYFNQIGRATKGIRKDIILQRFYMQRQRQAGSSEELPAPEPDSTGKGVIAAQPGSYCENIFFCDYLKAINSSYSLYYPNISSLVLDLPQEEYGADFLLQARQANESMLPWEMFTVNVDYNRLHSFDSITLLFGESFGIMLTNSSFSTLLYTDNGIQISQHAKPYLNLTGKQTEQLELYVYGTDAIISIANANYSLQLPEPLQGREVKMYHLNTYSTINELSVKNMEPGCLGEEYYQFCEIILRVTQYSSSRQPPLSQYGKVQPVSEIPEQQGLLRSLLGALGRGRLPPAQAELNLSYLPEIDLDIPSKTTLFSGPMAIIRNSTNLTFSATYKYLDGAGIVDIAFNTIGGEPLLSLASYTLENKSLVTFRKGAGYGNLTIPLSTPLDEWHTISIELYDSNITFVQNRTPIAFIHHNTTFNGFFSVSTIHTHAELRDTQIYYPRTRSRISLPLLEDPCDLRLIHTEMIRDENFTLAPRASLNFTNDFTLSEFFDYGKVSVELNGSSGTNDTLKIHFWLVRS